MTYEQFIEQVKWEVEDIARESFDDVRTVVRTVTKNNNVRRKTMSIFKEGQLATPTIYLRDYYLDYKKGVDFGLLTLLGTVFGIAVGLGFGNHFTYVEIFGRVLQVEWCRVGIVLDVTYIVLPISLTFLKYRIIP